jgi:YVTN family beta-propeller protein
MTYDRDGDSIRYQFDCGDGTTEITDYGPSGRSVQVSHAWSAGGIYQVRVLAQDKHGNSSAWSASVPVTIAGYPNRVKATIPVGGTPEGLAVLPAGDRLYVTRSDANLVLVVRTSDNVVETEVPVGRAPHGITASPAGDYVYVACNRSDSVAVIRTTDDSVVARVPAGDAPFEVAVLPNGHYVYVTNLYSDDVSVIRTTDNTVVATISTGWTPTGIAALPDGQRVYAAGCRSNDISVIQTANNMVIQEIELGQYVRRLAVASGGERAYATTEHGVGVIRTSGNNLAGYIQLDSGATGVAVLPNDSLVCVTTGNNSIALISAPDTAIVARVTVGRNPSAVAVAPDGRQLYVANSGDGTVSVVGY